MQYNIGGGGGGANDLTHYKNVNAINFCEGGDKWYGFLCIQVQFKSLHSCSLGNTIIPDIVMSV